MPLELPPDMDWPAIGPALAVTVTGCVVMLADLFVRRGGERRLALLSMLGLLITAVLAAFQWGNERTAFAGMVVADNFGQFFNIIFVIIAAITVLISIPYMDREEMHSGEYYTLLLFCTAGMMLMAGAADLIMVFLGLELLSLCLYMLSGFSRVRLESEEASIKYLLLGAFASGFLLYGIALTYGSTGSTSLTRIGAAVRGDAVAPLLLVGMGLLIVGLGFKAAVAPFHMWTPDVYEGAPTSITAYMSVAAKAAAFAAFVRVFLVAFPALQVDWTVMLGAVAAITMVLGNVVAIQQQNVKRMLAYSSIAHAGYILVAVVAGGLQRQLGAQGVLFYTLAYTLMNLGAFTVVILLNRQGQEGEQLADYAGLGYRRPLLAAAMALFMLSLAGIPPTVGFVGKFYIFTAAVAAGQLPLAVILALTSAVSVYFYIRVIYIMYMQEPSAEPVVGMRARCPTAALAVSAAGVLLLGIFPDYVFLLAGDSVRFLPL